jgi:Riboflavin synthase alpha chain
MFTGIIEEIGTIKTIQHGANSAVLEIQASKVLEKTLLGDSISTNGVCLTVVEQTKDSFRVEAMNETLARTNLGALEQGAKVNLERALAMGDRLGGHMVSGHIDGIGVIQSLRQDDIAWWVQVQCDDKLMRYIIEKVALRLMESV